MNQKIKYKTNKKIDFKKSSVNDVKKYLLDSGCWPFIKQRPYDIIADPENKPKAIFISAHATAPLAVDYNFTLESKKDELQAALTAISKFAEGNVHVGILKKF